MNLFYTFLSISKDLSTIHSKHIPLSQLLSSLNTSVVHGVLSTLYVSVLKGFHQYWTEQTTSHNEWSFVKCVDKKRFIYRIKDRVILGMQSHLAIFLWPTRIRVSRRRGWNLEDPQLGIYVCASHAKGCSFKHIPLPNPSQDVR